eukprot:6195581-Amphidinium_carterae.1
MEGEYLCLVAAAIGVSGANWADALRSARTTAALNSRKEAPAVPTFKRRSSLGRPFTLAELGQDFRRLLAGVGPSRVSCLTPHGLKTTCLSWAEVGAKAEKWRLLGWHSQSDEKMIVTYAVITCRRLCMNRRPCW